MVGGCWWFQFFAKHRVCSAVGAINGHQHGLRWRVTTMVTDKPLSSGTAPPRSFAMAIQPPPFVAPPLPDGEDPRVGPQQYWGGHLTGG